MTTARQATPTCSLRTSQAFRRDPLRRYTLECTFCGTPAPRTHTPGKRFATSDDPRVNAAEALAYWNAYPALAIYENTEGGYVVIPVEERVTRAYTMTCPEELTALLAA